MKPRIIIHGLGELFLPLEHHCQHHQWNVNIVNVISIIVLCKGKVRDISFVFTGPVPDHWKPMSLIDI